MIRSLSRPAAALAVALAVATVLAANRRTGPFAVVDRASVFEDDKGVHVSVTNPRSVLRTVLMDDQKYAALIESHLQALLGLVSGAAFGTPAGEDYGQRREKGTIGKTMGVMAGGPFDDKVADVSVMAGEDWKGVAERVRVGLEKKGELRGQHVPHEDVLRGRGQVGVHEEHGHARLHRGRDLRADPPRGRRSLTPLATPGPRRRARRRGGVHSCNGPTQGASVRSRRPSGERPSSSRCW